MWRSSRSLLLAAVAVLLAGGATLDAAGASAPSGSRPDGPPAMFRVGASVEDLDPTVPVYPGGYGSFAGNKPTTTTYAPLQVRAFYVANATTAVVLVAVDSQAWFAAVQQGPWGISDARRDAAAALAAAHLGPAVSASHLIVQATHSHSAPTVEGIWGPVPDTYLRAVHDQTVAAVVAAARAAVPAHLSIGSVSSKDIDDVTITDDTLAGWLTDGTVSVLRATRPDTGATIATYVTVPAHPVVINGQARSELGPDYFGALRDDLTGLLGGTVVAAPAVLGRQEPPVQTTDFTQLAFYARALTGLAARAAAAAHPVTDPTLAASETMLAAPASNAAILALVYAWKVPEPERTRLASAATLYPADRSISPPYLTGTIVGTPLTALRIGRTLLLSMPGEPYPEVVAAVRAAVSGADAVIALSKGQDDLGYFMPAWSYAYGVADGTDHPVFSVAPQLGDQVAQADAGLAAGLGFGAAPVALSPPQAHDATALLRPGLQALAATAAGDAGPDGLFHPQLEAIYNPAPEHGSPDTGGVHWSFGDGAQATTGYLLTATGVQGSSFVDHGFAPAAGGPRSYPVTVTATDAAGDVATWTTTITAYPALRAAIGRSAAGPGRVRLSARASGGDGRVLAATWSLGGRVIASGTTLVLTSAQAAQVSVVVVDGTGTTSPAS